MKVMDEEDLFGYVLVLIGYMERVLLCLLDRTAGQTNLRQGRWMKQIRCLSHDTLFQFKFSSSPTPFLVPAL